MRILLITTYFTPDAGAAAVRLTRLAKQLAQRGHEVTVLTTMPHYPQGKIADAYRGKFTIRETLEGVQIVRVWLYATPSSKIILRLLSQISFMVTLFLRGLFLARPDVVFIESQPVFTSLGGMVLSLFKRTPYVLNVSDLWPEYLTTVGVMKESHPLYKLFKLLVNITQRRAKGMVALYPSILDSINARIGTGPNRQVIFNAVDLERFRPNLDSSRFRQKYDLNPEDKIISFVGTFGTHIDFETMLDAAASFKDRTDVKFVFIGTGGQRDKVQGRLDQGDLNHVQWIGWIDHDEMPLAWAASYITFWAIRNHELYRYILQSKIYEALATGTPVAIAVEGITTDIVDKSGAGFTVPFSDSKALAEAIDRLIDDPLLHRTMSQAARAYAETHFYAERVADQYETLLKGSVSK